MRALPLLLLAALVPPLAAAQSRPVEQREGITWEVQPIDAKGTQKGRWKNDNSVCKVVTFHFEKDGKKEGSDYQVTLNTRESKPMEYNPTSTTHLPRITQVESCR